jgi:RND family efflux transporter MFP subunit
MMRTRTGLAALGFAVLASALAVWSLAAHPAAGDGSADATSTPDAANADTPSVLVTTIPLQRGSLPRTVTAYGVVQADTAARATIVAPVAAMLTRIYVHRGESVHGGAALVQLTPSAPTRAAYAQATAAMRLASAALEHERELLAEHLATRQQLDDAQKAESDARAALAALAAQGAGAPATLRAPFAGVVLDIMASPHALLTEGTVLLELSQATGLTLTVGAAPDAAVQIAAGDQAEVTAVGAAHAWPTHVISPGALVDAASGLVPVRVALPQGRWLAGESARAVITVGMAQGYVVPHAAVLLDDDAHPYVVQDHGGMARIVHVTVVGSDGAHDAITGPLDADAPLVLEGNYQAQDGMKLRHAGTGAALAPAPASTPQRP